MEPRSSSWMKPTFGPMPTCEANGYSRERQRWWTPPVPGGERRPATTRGVCLETGEVEAMEIAGNSNAETSTAFLQQLRENYPGPLVVIWDNGPAHRGAAIRSYLTTPDLHLRLVALPAYSPDFNADEAVWDWAREEVTANECLGTKAKVQEKMNQFFGGLAHRKDEVKRRCRTRLQARADALIFTPAVPLPSLPNVVPTLALV